MSGWFIDVRRTVGGYSIVGNRSTESSIEESSIAERRALLLKGELYCKEKSSIMEHSIAENI